MRFDPARHTVVRIEVVPSKSGRGAKETIIGWFARIVYTGNPVREFRGERSDVEFFDTKLAAENFVAGFARDGDTVYIEPSHDLLH